MTAAMPEPVAIASNLPEFTVSEISQAVKRTLETSFERVRVRGEVSKPNYHGSGHLYFSLKDESAAIDAVCWRGSLARLKLKLEHGMEVIVSGRISSYPGSSKYQIVIDSVELAGEGALLKMLEERKRKRWPPRACSTPTARSRCLTCRRSSESSPRPPAPSSGISCTASPTASRAA